MELSSEDAEIPMPINSVYGGVLHGHGHHGHMSHHHHHHHQQENHFQPQPPSPEHHHHHHHAIIPPSSSPSHHHHHQNMIPSLSTITPINNGTNTTTTSALNLEEVPYNVNNNRGSAPKNDNKVVMMMRPRVRYRECQKNHAASMGGNATDGCGEFMPSGEEEGTLESLTCSVCNCHRNFHRREIEGGGGGGGGGGGAHHEYHPPLLPPPPPPHHFNYHSTPHHLRGRKVILGAPSTTVGGGGGGGAMTFSHHLPYPSTHFQVGSTGGGGGPRYSASDDQSDDHDRNNEKIHHQKKRFRTKFSQEQKEKMLEFAEKVGWKIQRQEEAVIQKFCQEVGVKRRVLKVWMHNNKHTLAKKSISHDPNTNNNFSSLHA